MSTSVHNSVFIGAALKSELPSTRQFLCHVHLQRCFDKNATRNLHCDVRAMMDDILLTIYDEETARQRATELLEKVKGGALLDV